MKRLQAFKFQLRPGGQQEREMRRFAGACRFVFNRALARQNENHEVGNKYIPYGKMASWLVEWKNATETQWLKDAPSQPLQQSLKDLERAYKNFFRKRAAFPRFKKRGQNDVFRYPQGVKLDQENSRQVTGVVKNVTVSQSCGKWYISIQTESEVSTPVHPSASMVGLDAGVAKLATLSDGTVFEPVNSFQKNQKKLARLQRQLSRKVKFSNNWQKQKRKIQRLHSCIANIRRDYLHKVTTTVSKNHAMIVIEDLKVSNMSKSAAGTVSQPGRNVRAKSGLNRSILDQGWYEMRRQLEYKQLWRGGQVLAVPPAYTSQRCACCGHTAKENRLSQSKFRCQVCGYTANADVNGARNILAAGHAVLACGEMVQSGRPLKQEPTEMIQATA
ncbi:TPA: RNA-guided endonuclease InsQ/TnpB family protein [Escherichia coli]|uniref:RNA-guided endonuclease InsQ/TnpB family protein n=2 Tax=Escherichia coli TaxID=562 RepID=UPI0007E8FAAA|nr:RNA-guided endonuclease TnpB family protein [Escherichia coli]EFE7304943.1 IS200/IS605 family element transposase accessory protein TnpB [Escherichia coli]EHC8057324.1 IS200/IS605 family element transposase accessory protein TnpB [Escherichia coli]EHC8202120.1 IS200/IS605 family element transposase accessory protein TnpB [Escherichia coli]EKF1707207.1 transposase [Escherichia coli]MCA6838054.1 transposase [Escherichia coli]